MFGFLYTQIENPRKKDWIKTGEEDLGSLGIKLNMNEIERMTNATLKNMFKKSIKYISFTYLNNKRTNRNGKGIEMKYEHLEMQNYLNSLDIDITNEERKVIFPLRNKM